jgi:hypothetical protein
MWNVIVLPPSSWSKGNPSKKPARKTGKQSEQLAENRSLIYARRVPRGSGSAPIGCLRVPFLGPLFYNENGRIDFLRNVGGLQPNYTALQPTT